MLIRDAMTHPVTTVLPTDGIALASRAMWEGRIQQLPVVDEAGRLVGIVTDRDLRADGGAGGSRVETPVSQVMTDDPIRVGPDGPIEDGARRLFENRFGALPVVDERNRVVGIVTRTDILSVLMTILEMRETAGRVEVELGQDARSAAGAFGALDPATPVVSAIIARSPSDGTKRALHLRLGASATEAAREALKRAGFHIRETGEGPREAG